jgi:hypothetical protein
MARISTYALDAAINDADKLIGTDADNNNQTKNFSLEGIAEYVIDKLIDPDSNQALIPVFRNIENTDGANATRITGSIMYQDTYPTGTQIGIAGNLLVEQNATVYLNLSVAGESYLLGNVYLGTTPADSIKQRGTLELLAPVKDSTGTLGSSEQVLVSNASGILSWENYQGTGLEFQSSWNANTNVPDLTAIPLDGDNTGKYWVVSVEGTTNLSGISQWSPGDWAIISQDDSDNVFWSKIDNSSVDGLGEVNKLAVWDSPKTLTFTPDIEFTAPSTLTLGNNISSEAKIILQQFNPSIELGNTFKISHPLNGNAIISETGGGDLLLLSDNEVEIKSGELGETFARFTKDGPIELYHDNTKVFNTTTTGIYVTGAQSFFSGQVSIPTTPVAGTDAASKAYVDLQNINKVSGNGRVFYGAMWDGTLIGSSGSTALTTSPLSFRITDTGTGVQQPRSLAFGGNSTATGARNSVAMGYANTSSAESSLATGHNTTASGLHAASFNFSTTASGEKSAAFGDNTVASGKNSFAIGANTIAATSLSFAGGKNSAANPDVNFETAFAYGDNVSSTGNNSAAFGKGTVASGERAFVTGNNNQAQGLNSVAFGGSNSAIGDLTFVAGSGNQAVQSGSIAIGTNNNTGGYPNVTAIGVGLQGHQDEQVVLGKYNSATNDKFVVGNGFNGNPKNGLQISNTSIRIPDYGSGNVTGTAARNLAVDVTGKIIETPVVVKDYLSAVLLISQSGTANPQVNNVLENGLGIPSPFNWTRVSSGEYNLNAPGKFKLLKTIVFVNGGSAENNHDVAWEVIDADNLRIRTHNSDGKLTKASLEIKTYN